MDANGTRLFMLLGERDWSACVDQDGIPFSEIMKTGPEEYLESTKGLGWEDKRFEVILHPRLMKFKAAPLDIPPTIDNRRGADRDQYGNWYWIDPTKTEILVNSAGTGMTSHFWSSADQELHVEEVVAGEFRPKESPPAPSSCKFGGLTITEDHFLLVGVLRPAGLLVFDLHAGGSPRKILWPESVAFEPFDMAAAPGGGAWILDRTNKRHWRIDKYLNLLSHDQSTEQGLPPEFEDFHDESGSPEKRQPGHFPTGTPLPISSPILGFDPIAIESLPDGTVLILDTNSVLGSSVISRYEYSKKLGKEIVLDEFEFAAHDFAFVPEHETSEGTISDRLYVVSTEGNQTYAFDISLDDDGNLLLKLLNEYFPMRLFGGKALVVSDTIAYYDFGTSWVPLIQQLRPQYTVEGTLYTPLGEGRPPFDGRVPDCVWHRLMLDACIPPGTSISVWSRAANDVSRLNTADWREEPSLHLRGDGTELPFVAGESRKDAGTWELLFQRAIGRYLQLRLTFYGSGRDTPRVRCLRVYAPRFSYLKEYLPAAYREDETSASFLDRFLANFEGTFTAIEDKIAAVQILFDAMSAPPETLDWLANWLGVSLDPKWDEPRRRLFIKHSMTFFNLRGTIRGIQIALQLALNECVDESIFDDDPRKCDSAGGIRIIEKFRTRWTPAILLGDPTESTGLRTVSSTTNWQPAYGRDILQQLYRKRFGMSNQESLPLKSTNEITQNDWKKFTEEAIGFVPSSTTGDNVLWQEFLARRYKQPSILNDAYKLGKGKGLGSFAEAKLPESLPTDGAALTDWYEFQAVALTTDRLAHRFSVLIPIEGSESADLAGRRDKLELARRIVDLQKPAHTVFEVKFYLDLFRVGMVRLGIDTVLDAGSRSPYFVSPTVLGQSYLLESYLAPYHPQDVMDRVILGRGKLGT